MKGAEPPAGVTIYRVPFERMKNSELKEYLNTFSDDSEISLILANPMKRKLYEVERVDCITDMEQPVFCVTVGQPKDMDEEMV